jgi:hypothetical protein
MLRMEIFKRDSFTCQYCGNKAPESILHVDHIKPVSKGGTNDIFNLITSCIDCNLGKSDRELSDDTVIIKQRNQLEELQQRREQLDMLYEWQCGMKGIDKDKNEKAIEYLEDSFDIKTTEYAKMELYKIVSRFDFQDVLDSIDIAADQYLDTDKTEKNVRFAFDKIKGICKNKKTEKDNPFLADCRHVSNIANKKYQYYNRDKGMYMINKALSNGFCKVHLILMINKYRSFSEFYDELAECLGD